MTTAYICNLSKNVSHLVQLKLTFDVIRAEIIPDEWDDY